MNNSVSLPLGKRELRSERLGLSIWWRIFVVKSKIASPEQRQAVLLKSYTAW